MPEQVTHPGNLRLAMRVEGNFWKAYAARLNTTEGAVLLGSIAMAAVTRSPKRKQAFVDLMRDALDDFVRDITGSALRWNEPAPAPEYKPVDPECGPPGG
jgi:F0F1-type ATP synthase membrane subunit a